MKLRGIGWVLAATGIAWLGAVSQAEGGGAPCDLLICPDDLFVCVEEDGEARIFDDTSGCQYFGEGAVKENEKKGYLKVKAKGTNDDYGCGEKAKVKVKYDPDTGECIKKAKVKVGDEKREIATPAPCSCGEPT